MSLAEIRYMDNVYGPPAPMNVFPSNPSDIGFRSSAPEFDSSFSSVITDRVPTDTSEKLSNDINVNLSGMISRGGAFFKYHNVPMFLIRCDPSLMETTSVNSHQLVSLWHLNAMWRKYFLVQSQNMAAMATRKRFATDEPQDAWLPKTIKEFKEMVKFGGMKISGLQGDPDDQFRSHRPNHGTIGTKMQGEINNIPNIWGNDVKKGQSVGFAVRWETLYVENIRDWDGSGFEIKNVATSFKCLQIVPIIAKQGRVPYGVTAKIRNYADSKKPLLTFNVNKHDGNTSEPRRYTWRNNGRATLSAPEETEVMAHFIPIGHVIRRRGFPSHSDVEEAIATFSGYHQLGKNNEDIDLQMFSEGKRFTWICA